MERNDKLIKKKVYKYMVTGVMITVAMQLGNVVDAIIVGNLLGSIGNAAVSASTPYLYILQAAAILLGSGGAVTAAVLLGKRDAESSGKVMGFCMVFSIAYPLVFTCLFPVLIPAFITVTGAQGELAEMIRNITTVYSVGMPILSFAIVMAYFINVDNHPAMAARLHIVANAVNLILDYILVRFTSLGITGAAMSTILGYLTAGLIFIPRYFRSKNRMLRPQFKGMFRSRDLIGSTCKHGFPNLAYLIMTVISVGVINASALRTLGKEYFSAYAVANNTQLIVQMFLNGVSSVTASVAGVLYGEKDFFGMRRVFARVLRTAMIIGTVIMLVFLAVPQAIAGLYGFDNDAVRPELCAGLRIFALSFLIFSLNALAQNYYRTIGQTFLSTASSVMQLIIFKIPLMLTGMALFGFKGLFEAIILSELLSFAIINLIRMAMQRAGKVPQKGFLAIPEQKPGAICDMSVTGSETTAVSVSERIIEYCSAEHVPPAKAQIMGIAAEEIIDNISRYGYRASEEKNIDICLSKADGKYILRIRDDGVPFNPVAYEAEEREPQEIGGLELLRRMAVKMNYMRAISLNNTIIEIDLNTQNEEG